MTLPDTKVECRSQPSDGEISQSGISVIAAREIQPQNHNDGANTMPGAAQEVTQRPLISDPCLTESS